MQDIEMLKESVISAVSNSERSRIKCPMCGPERKKKGERTLSITVDGSHALYKCHHCDESGRVEIEDLWMMSSNDHTKGS